MQIGESQFLGDVDVYGVCSGFSEHGTWSSSSEIISGTSSYDIDIPLSKGGFKWGTFWAANSNSGVVGESQGIRVYFTDDEDEAACAEGAEYGRIYSKTTGNTYLSGNWLGSDIRLQNVSINPAGDEINIQVYNSSVAPRSLSMFMVWRVLQ